MRPVGLVAACLLAAVAAGGCVRSASQPAATPTTAAAASTTRGPADTTGPQTTTTTAAARWTTAPKARTHNPEGMPMLAAIRTGRHGGYDRVVLEFRNGLPGWRAWYVDKVSSESGEVVSLEGAASLLVDVSPASGHGDTPPFKVTYTGPRTLTPHHPTLRQVVWVDDFEGHLSFGLGLRARVGFRVLELRDPARLAIDVAHGAT